MAKTTFEIETKLTGGGDSVKSLKELKQEFNEIQKELTGLQPGTDKYVQTLSRLGSVKDEIGDLRNEINSLAGTDQKIGAFTNVLGGVASGFAAAQGAAALFGGESEDLQKSLVKIQAAMAFADGIKGLAAMGDSVKALGTVLKSTTAGTYLAAAAQRVYNVVMAANPIGLIIAGLTALVGVIALVVNAMKDENEAQKLVIANRERELEVMQDQDAALQKQADFRKNLAAAEGKSAREQLQLSRELGKERTKRIDQEIVLLKKQLEERTKLIKDSDDEEIKDIQEKNKKDAELIKKLGIEKNDILNQYLLDKTKLETEERKATEEKEKENSAKAKERAKKKAEDDADEREYWRKRRLEEQAAEQFFADELEEEEKKKKILREKALQDELEKNAKQNDDFNYQLYLKQKERDKERAEGFKQLELQKVEWAKQGLTLISDLNELFAGKSIEQQKKAFEIDKAVKLATATISGIEGVQNAYKSAAGSPITSVFPAYPFVQAGIAGAFAAVNIAKIAKTKFNGGAGSVAPSGGGGGNLGSFSQGSGQPPQGLTSQNTVTQLNPDGTVANGERKAAPVKAYVVESESRAVTERVNKLSNNSKIG